LFTRISLLIMAGAATTVALTACTPNEPGRQTAPTNTTEKQRPPAARARTTLTLSKVVNRARLGNLTSRQKKLLSSQGFFLAPQPSRKPGDRATHLFHIYERNDYVAFPSFVTVDLAIDTTHAYFDAVLREIESLHLVPKLKAALVSLMKEAEAVRRSARTRRAKGAAVRAVAYWAVALRLLEQPARGDAPDVETVPLPGGMAPERPAPKPSRQPKAKRTPVPNSATRLVTRAVAQIHKASGRLPKGIVRSDLDLTQMRPRGHYTRTGVLQRFFRSMSWLGMASFPLQGDRADVIGVMLLARSYLGSEAGAKALDRVQSVTTYFVGGPDAADLAAAARLLVAVMPKASKAKADTMTQPDTLKRYAAQLATLPAPKIQSTATTASAPSQVRVMGRRAFEDNVALQKLIGALNNIAMKGADSESMVRAPGALGSAALLGSDLAKRLIVTPKPGVTHTALGQAIDRGRLHISGLPVTRWGQDAYHGTLHALRGLLPAPPATAPHMLRTPGWRLRALQAFAGGWAELRHDTILYGEQSGAECDAPDPPAPPGWVEPVPQVYQRLATMVQVLDKRLRAAGIPLKTRPNTSRSYASPLAAKTKNLVGILHFLRDAARQELLGKPLTAKQRKRITLIGGEVEWLLISLANTETLAKRDQDMAVIADVFTWRSAGKAVEVGVGHPEMIYAIIPGPKGPVLARGAVMSYRAFLQPVTKRLTDPEWRKRLASGRVPPRPTWLSPIYAEPVPVIKPKGHGVSRCGPSSGAGLKL
jgi:Protein of unknown function (DUF3160)